MGALPGWRAYEGQLAWKKHRAEVLETTRLFAFLILFMTALALAALIVLALILIFPDFLDFLLIENFRATISLFFIYLLFVAVFTARFAAEIDYPENLLWSKRYREVKFPWRLKKKE